MNGGKLIVLDIDRTLFNPDSFLEELSTRLSWEFDLRKEKLLQVYFESKPQDYFDPQVFLKNISEAFDVDLKRLGEIFWDQKLINDALFEDTHWVEEISRKAKIAIFSKGEYKFQRRKIVKLRNFLKDEDIYIFPNKIEKIPQVFGKYEKFEIITVDDDREVLENVKLFNSNITTILIDRILKQVQDDNSLENGKIDALISNLEEIYPYVSS